MKIIIIFVYLFVYCSSLLAQTITVYSYRQPQLIAPLVKTFEKKTNKQISLLFLDKGLNERLASEGKYSPADLILTVDVQRLNQLVEKDLVQPLISKKLEKLVPSNLKDPNHLWYALSMRARVIYASKERILKNSVQNYSDLALAKWKGKVCIRSGKHNYNLGLIATLIAQNGKQTTKKWLLNIKNNLSRKPQGNDRAGIKAIYSGECDLSLGNSYYLGVMANNEKNPVQKKWAKSVYIITPNQKQEGVNVNISGIALAKYAPNKKDAILFAEFLVSKEAQEIYAKINHEFPIRDDVPLSNFTKKNFGEFKKNIKGIKEIPLYYENALDLVEEIRFDF